MLTPCNKCGKPTRSHQVGLRIYCHTCFLNLTAEEIKEVEAIAAKRKIEGAMELVFEVLK
jgi:hypothetical protein